MSFKKKAKPKNTAPELISYWRGENTYMVFLDKANTV